MNTRINPLKIQERAGIRVLGLIVLAVLLTVFIGGGPPSYRKFKGWRSRNLAAQAEFALDRNDLTNATRIAQAAHLMSPSEPAALRAAAKVQTRAGHPNAFEFWQALI